MDEITYASSIEGLSARSLTGGFFDGWATPLTPDEHLDLLGRATHVTLALAGPMVVGFANALSDGMFSAYVPLLEVLPAHRGRGIGSELMKRLLVEIGPLYMVDVMCEDDVVAFYERLGFSASGGVIRRNHRWRDSGQ